jgi:poly-gamma-glutamate capsule biosynthesis protein CapA/YwtB (metallophosphatase superfamily)
MRGDDLTLALCGDVMLGRGIDQILPHAGDPALREEYVADAREYVALAEAVSGPIPRPVDFSWPWGDALRTLAEAAPDAWVVNLETSITRSDDFSPGKAVHYRMHPDNLPCLTTARPDVCVLANNHVLDFGRSGLRETLDSLSGSGLRAVGAGRDTVEAWQPVAIPVDGGGRVLVFSFGMPSSGIPPDWAATEELSGVGFVPGPSTDAAARIAERVRQARLPGDVAVVSVHWGSNWGYRVPREHVRFAHTLIDGGVDAVHGHSSHHPRPIEVYRDRLILYGCGDFIDDYEGISGFEEYRDDLRLLYFVSVRPPVGTGKPGEPGTGTLTGLRMAPLRAERMRLRHPSDEDSAWLRATLHRISRGHGVPIGLEPDGMLTFSPASRS